MLGQDLNLPNMGGSAGGGAGGGFGGFGPDFWNSFGGLAGGLAGLFGGDNYQNPADSAAPYYNKIPGSIQPYFQPYINAGQNATGDLSGRLAQMTKLYPQLAGQFSQLMNNPGGFINKMGAGYQQSPGYQFQTNQALNAANRASAAGGMAGSPQEQQQIAGVTNQLANQDFNQYLGHVLNTYGQGLGGLSGLFDKGLQGEQYLAGLGGDMAGHYGDDLANTLMSQGNLAYAGTQNQNQADQSWWGNLGGMITGGLGMLGGM